MADVSDVHDVVHALTRQFQRTSQDIRIEKRTKVSDMRIVVNRRPA
jgi:hypothetical protein